MADRKQIPALPEATTAADDDFFIKRDTQSGTDEKLAISLLLTRSGEQVSEHSNEEGGVHGIPVGERALHTEDSDPSLVYRQDNILGAVSQSSGLPTGAIIERGSNSDGEYVKFADGSLQTFSDIDVDTTTSDLQFFSTPSDFQSGTIKAVTMHNNNAAGVGRDIMLNSTAHVTEDTESEIRIRISPDGVALNDINPRTMFVGVSGRWY